MKKISLFLLVVVFSLSLTACKSEETKLENIGLGGLSAKEILTGVGDGSIIVDGFALSVYDDELIVIVDKTNVVLDMPADEFYLSVAPWKTITHECLYHSATGCRGELKQESFFVEFIDKDGNVIISENMATMTNGFIDLWLPRNIEGTLTITQGELSASKVITTESGDPTCETTMQLM